MSWAYAPEILFDPAQARDHLSHRITNGCCKYSAILLISQTCCNTFGVAHVLQHFWYRTLAATLLVSHIWKHFCCRTLAGKSLVSQTCCNTFGVADLLQHCWCRTLAATLLVSDLLQHFWCRTLAETPLVSHTVTWICALLCFFTPASRSPES